jgi:hypothetical protein
VGDFAKAMANIYGVRGEFRDFWEARQGRSYWLSLLRAKMERITGGMPTLNFGVDKQLVVFREALDRLPALDRDLYLIWLQSTFTEPALANDADLSAAVKRLGRDRVLAIAEGNPPGGDPELRPSRNPLEYRLVAEIVLNHAGGVLLPVDADRLSAVVQRERDRVKAYPRPETFVSPAYTIAQARLLPEKASEILHDEIRFRSGKFEATARGQLATALLEMLGQKELSFVRELF